MLYILHSCTHATHTVPILREFRINICRKIDEYKKFPMILVSSIGDSLKEIAKNIGATCSFPKPVKQAVLLDAVKKQLNTLSNSTTEKYIIEPAIGNGPLIMAPSITSLENVVVQNTEAATVSQIPFGLSHVTSLVGSLGVIATGVICCMYHNVPEILHNLTIDSLGECSGALHISNL